MVTKHSTPTKTRYTIGGTVNTNPVGLGFWTKITLDHRDDDIIVILNEKMAKHPNILTQQLYGRDNLIWLVWQYNNILDPITELIPGMKIVMPNPIRLL